MKTKPTLKFAAESLGRFISGGTKQFPPWLAAIGKAQSNREPAAQIIVYVKRRKNPVPTEWMGFPVRTVYIGRSGLSPACFA